MCRGPILLGIITCFVAASSFPVGYVKAKNIPLTEERAAAARAQAAVARENADRAALTALIAEKQAGWAGQKSTVACRTEVDRELAKFKARKTAHGAVLPLGDVIFAPDQSEPPTAALRKLSPLVTFLKDHPQRNIRIEGYADSRGPESYNLDLAQRRADTVRDFLIANGISPRRITTRGYGEALSVASNTTLAGQRENPRVEVVVRGKASAPVWPQDKK